MEIHVIKTGMLNASGRDVLWDSVINDISGENADSAMTENRLRR